MTQDPRVEQFISSFQALRGEVEKVIVGHREIIDHVLTGMFAGGHVLLEGVRSNPHEETPDLGSLCAF